MSQNGPRAELEQRIEAVEGGYEFLLAYAAQGRDTDKGAPAGRNVREYLERMSSALDGLGASAEPRRRVARTIAAASRTSAPPISIVLKLCQKTLRTK